MIKFLTFLFLLISCTLFAQQPAIEYSPYSDKTEINHTGKNITDSIFNYIRNELPFMEFEDCNNCDSRAHLLSALLENKFRVKISKVWLFADYKRASQTEKYKFKPDIYLTLGDDCNRWGYHVAPIIIFKCNNKIDTIVIDPSIHAAPASLQGWTTNLIKPGSKGYLIIKDRKYFSFPDDKNKKFEDTKELWIDNENKQLFDDDYSISIDIILAAKYGYWGHWIYRYWQNAIHDMLEMEQNTASEAN